MTPQEQYQLLEDHGYSIGLEKIDITLFDSSYSLFKGKEKVTSIRGSLEECLPKFFNHVFCFVDCKIKITEEVMRDFSMKGKHVIEAVGYKLTIEMRPGYQSLVVGDTLTITTTKF